VYDSTKECDAKAGKRGARFVVTKKPRVAAAFANSKEVPP